MAVIFSKTSGVKGSPPQKSDKCWTPPLAEKIFHFTGRRSLRVKVNTFKRIFNKYQFLKSAKNHTKVEIIKELVRLSAIKIPNRVGYKIRRKKNQHAMLVGKCVCCGGQSSVLHHAVMVINGGPNNRHNLVELCSSCHAEIHPWMPVPATREIISMDNSFRDTVS